MPVLFFFPLAESGLYKHVILELDKINRAWNELVAQQKKSNSKGHEQYEEIYDKMIAKFPAKILEDFTMNKDNQMTKRSNRVKNDPPQATEADADDDEIKEVIMH